MADFHKNRFTLEDLMKIFNLEFKDEPFIHYDPKVDWQYQIVREIKHVGTKAFEYDFMLNALMPLLQRNSHYRAEPPKENMLPVYTVGQIKMATVYGQVDLPIGRYPGERQRIRIPVRVDWVPVPEGAVVIHEVVK